MTRADRRRRRASAVPPFDVVRGNELVPIERGSTYYTRMIEAIAEARSSVAVEMYLWDDDDVGRRFVDALRDAAARGVHVRVLVDALGSSGAIGPLAEVLAAGGDVRVYGPFRIRFLRRWFHRTHKKILVCDGVRAFTGGAGFAQHWTSGMRQKGPWHDRMFEMRGPVVRQFETVFDADFARWLPAAPRSEAPPPAAAEPGVIPGGVSLRVLRGWPDARDFRASLLTAVRGAKERVWIGTPYFIPPPSLIRALRDALRRGVEVRLVLPSGNYAHPLLWHASRRHYGFFIARGARIRERSDGFYHAKLAVIDRTCAIVGSSNLDYWSWDRNAEIDVEASDEKGVAIVAAEFERDFERAGEVARREVGMRSVWNVVRDAFTRWIERWL